MVGTSQPKCLFAKSKRFSRNFHPHLDGMRIDMLYSLLKTKIQKKVPRNSVVSIDQLIDAANRVEHLKNDKRVGINDDTALKELYHF